MKREKQKSMLNLLEHNKIKTKLRNKNVMGLLL